MPKTLAELSAKVRDIDFSALTTRTKDGALADRRMSNNPEVCNDGDEWFFAKETTRMVPDITADPGPAQLPRGIRAVGDATILPALAHFDVDHFKSIDDRFGHAAGDATVVGPAGALFIATRNSGLQAAGKVVRMSEDEFLVIMPSASLRAAQDRPIEVSRDGRRSSDLPSALA